jgi:hypothetical protein
VKPPADLLAAAKKEKAREPNKPRNGFVAIVPVIKMLRGKGFTWEQTAKWLTDNGRPSDAHAITQQYTRWKREQPK